MMSDPESLYNSIQSEIGTVIIGYEDVVKHLTVSLLTNGHVLLEGVPGIAKTTLARLFATTTGLNDSRIQMTPDLLPADVTGTSVYREATGEFEIQRGPVFTNLLIADEINRAPPKTQSALLEAMQENQVSIEGNTLALPDPFIVVATMNPIEMEGTFALPEAQRDRFQMKLNMELPDTSAEYAILDRFDDEPEAGSRTVSQVVSPDEILAAREAVASTHIEDSVKEYIVELIDETRRHPDIRHGASPRASIALQTAAKAVARIESRNYVIPDDIKEISQPVLRHRLILNADAELTDVDVEDIIEDIHQTVVPPSAKDSGSSRSAAADGGDQYQDR